MREQVFGSSVTTSTSSGLQRRGTSSYFHKNDDDDIDDIEKIGSATVNDKDPTVP